MKCSTHTKLTMNSQQTLAPTMAYITLVLLRIIMDNYYREACHHLVYQARPPVPVTGNLPLLLELAVNSSRA